VSDVSVLDVERQPQAVPAGELVPEHLDAELALGAQAEDQLFLFGEDLAVRRAVRPVAPRLEAGHALGLVAAPPLAQGRAGDAAPSADDPGVADCAAACPELILVTAEAGYPSVDFSRGECTFCGACAAACPEPIFAPRAETPWALVAAIGEACLTLRGVVCQSCRDACPTAAVRFELAYRSAPRPRVDAAACTGCGACVGGCPTAAIAVREPAAVPAHDG
jgi:ferredoxin-type protein NapF